MRQFSILRYLKQFSLLIFLLSLFGSAAIFVYGRSQQHYIASTTIQYTNKGAKDGYTPDGSPLQVEEIYSTTVIDAALSDLGYQSNIDSVRSNCYVEEVIPEAQQKLNEALLEKGEDPSYLTDTYRVYYVGDKDTGDDYARNMLDAIIKNYYEFYAEKYVEEQLQNNGVSVLSNGNYDYLESAQVLEDSVLETVDYLLDKRVSYPYFRSVETGYTYSDLYQIYNFLYNYEIPSLYSAILSDAETNDIELLRSRLSKDLEDMQLYIENREKRADSLKKLIENFSKQNKEMMDYHYSASSNGSNDIEYILRDVENNDESYNSETTYDSLVREYVDLNIDIHQKKIEKQHKEYLLSVFNSDPAKGSTKSFSPEEIQEKIDHCANLASEYYRYVEDTGHELNRYLSANYLTMISSISVEPAVNIKLYVAIAVILFALLGGIGAIVLGRTLDFIDYFRYIDKTVQLPNRARCDVYIEDHSARLLDDHFSCLTVRMDSLSRISGKFGRLAGDEVLKDFAMILKSFGDLYGFVGYNGSGVFYAFFPDCSSEKLDVIKKAISDQVSKYNNLNPGKEINCSFGTAVSSLDSVFEIRELLKLALRRMNSSETKQDSLEEKKKEETENVEVQTTE